MPCSSQRSICLRGGRYGFRDTSREQRGATTRAFATDGTARAATAHAMANPVRNPLNVFRSFRLNHLPTRRRRETTRKQSGGSHSRKPKRPPAAASSPPESAVSVRDRRFLLGHEPAC